MTTIRQQRVAELLFQELSILIGNELDDPKLALVTVVQVEISRDLRNAKVYVSHDDDDVPESEVLKRLARATSYMRSQIAVRLALRSVPELLFIYDHTPERAARVNELLQLIAQERNSTGGVAASTETMTPADDGQDTPDAEEI